MRRKVIDWYRGKFIPHENDPDNGIVFFGGFYKRHWTSRAVHVLVEFYLREWKWVLGFVFGAPAAVATLMKLLN